MVKRGETKKVTNKKIVKKTAKPKSTKTPKKEILKPADIFEATDNKDLAEIKNDDLFASDENIKVDKTDKKEEAVVEAVDLSQDDKTRFTLIKAELHYFKGLSIMLTLLMLCVFFAFGALFSSMYLEVKMMRTSVEGLISKTTIESTSDVYDLIGQIQEKNLADNQTLKDNLVEEVLQRLQEDETAQILPVVEN